MRYEAPETVERATALLAESAGEARVLAGGTDLLVQMRADVVEPALIVDIKRIAETRAITEDRGGWRIGAAVTGAELKEHPRLQQVWPGVVEAANLIGSTQVQGRATLGGNLCNGSPAADSVPALIAAGAVATLAGPQGRRELPVEDVMLGPRRLALGKGEIVVSFRLPPRPPRSSDAYLRFIPRTEMDIAVVGVGVSLTVDASGTISDLLALVREERVAPKLSEPVDLGALARSAADGTRHDGIAHDVYAGEGCWVEGDERRLRRLAENLLDNADRHARARVTVRVAREGGRVALSVEDDGPGVPAAMRERIFERFVRADDDERGSGLGLAICREIARAHGGDVVLEDRSRFVARLPVFEAT